MSSWTNNSSATVSRNASVISFARSDAEVSIFVVIYILLSATVVIGNVLVVASFTTNAKLRTGISMFFVSLAVSDLCVGLVSIPWWIYQLVCPTMKCCISNKASLVTLFHIFDIFSALASIMNLVAISIERRIVISNPKEVLKCGSHSKINVFLISVAWVLALVISVYNGIHSSLAHSRTRTLLLFICGFVVPLVVMVVIYIDIYRLVRKTQEKVSRQNGLEQRRARANTLEERKTAQTVIIITALFVAAWTPFFVVSLLYPYSPSSLPSAEKLKSLIDFVKWMHYSNSAVNPFVYAYRNEVIRKTMLRVIPKCFGCLCRCQCEVGAHKRRLHRY